MGRMETEAPDAVGFPTIRQDDRRASQRYPRCDLTPLHGSALGIVAA